MQWELKVLVSCSLYGTKMHIVLLDICSTISLLPLSPSIYLYLPPSPSLSISPLQRENHNFSPDNFNLLPTVREQCCNVAAVG